MQIPAYFINLDQAAPRKHHMETMAANAGIVLKRFPAINFDSLSDEEYRSWHPEGCSGSELSKGQICCFLSHMELWKIAASNDASYTAIFEDDINLSPSVQSFLSNDDWIPAAVDLLRLETTLSKTIVKKCGVKVHDDREIFELAGPHWGTAGYIISKTLAQRLLAEVTQIRLTVDRALFQRHAQFMPSLTAWQLSPGFCVQQQFSTQQFLPKDAQLTYLGSGAVSKLNPFKKLIREVKRPFIDMSHLINGRKKIKGSVR